jgi:hypothetical protein
MGITSPFSEPKTQCRLPRGWYGAGSGPERTTSPRQPVFQGGRAPNLGAHNGAALGRTRLLTEQRKQLAYAANVGDKAAKAKLTAINTEVATHGSEIENVEFALMEARARLKAAQQAEAASTDKAKALQLREKLAKFVELGMVLDDCFADFKSAATEMKSVVDDIHKLSCATPDNQLFRVNCDLAFKTAVQGTPFWSHDFPAMSPANRKTFGSLVKSWSNAIEANIAARLGEKKDAA